MEPRQDFDLDSLPTLIPAIFDQAQSSAATHKKNCVALHKVQIASAKIVEGGKGVRQDSEVKLVGERAFGEVVLDLLNRVLVVKRSTPPADRIVKFIGSYVRFIFEKDSGEEESTTSRFVMRLLRHFLKGFQAKNKDVRFRCLGFVSEIVSNLGEMDSDMYAELKNALLERLCDKEQLIRTLAVISLSKLAASEDVDDLEDDEEPIIMSLLNHLFEDPAPEVRRAALVHLPFSPTTLPALLTRMRDVDPLTRKAVFTAVLSRLEHPRLLTIGQREQVVTQGLGDRADAVRVAAARLLGTWVDACEGDLATFVKLFDVHTPDVARDALKSVFVTRAEIVEEIEFDDAFWASLTPEKAILASTFVEHCISTSDEKRLESTLPVVTALAFSVQKAYNSFLSLLQEDINDDDEAEDRDNRSADIEFILGELLRLALHLDYSDEIGRRKMFGIICDMIAHPELPESLIGRSVEVLHTMSPNERDLIRLVVEVISELRDKVMDEDAVSIALSDDQSMISSAKLPRGGGRKNLEDMTPEEKAEADLTDLRCLSIFIATLELMHGSFEENSSLEGILTDLVIPSVKRKEIVLREKGLVGLGLCCLVAKNLALNSFQLFFSQVKSSPEPLRIRVLQAIFDIMMTYEKEMMSGDDPVGNKVIPYLMQILESEESKSVQALICLGLSKLMLFGLCADERVLICLIIAYISPMTSENQELRQCLAYFLPLYCYTSPANQNLLRSVVMSTYDLALSVYGELDEDEKMISPLQLGQLLVDWTDASKIVGHEEGSADFPAVHVQLGVDIMRALYNNERDVEDRKTLCQLLGKLVFPSTSDRMLLNTLYILITNLPELCPFEDTNTTTLFTRFKSRFEKHFASSLMLYSETECFEDENDTYAEVFEFLGISKPRNRKFEGAVVNDSEAKGKRKGEKVGSKSRGVSVAPSEAESEAGPSKSNGRAQSVAATTDESETEQPASKNETQDEASPESDEELPDPKSSAKSNIRKASNGGQTKNHPPPPPETEPESESGNEVGIESDAQNATAASDSDSEIDSDREPTPKPSITPKKKGTKRAHIDTPTKSPTMASPPRKRTNRSTSKTNGARNARTKEGSPEPATAGPKARTKGNGQARGQARGRARGRARGGRSISRASAPQSDNPDSDTDSDSTAQAQSAANSASDSDSDVEEEESMPQQRRAKTSSRPQSSSRKQSRTNAKGNGRSKPPPVPRRVEEENIGWGDSDDF